MSAKRRRQATASPRPRGRPKVVPDEILRATVIQQARESFLEAGYDGTTMDQVAARCRMSKRTLYRLFPNKTQLLTAVIETHRQTMVDLPGDYDSLPLAEALERIFKVDIDMEADRERVAFVRFLVVEFEKYPELDSLARRHGPEKCLDLLTEWLSRQKELGRIEIDCPSGTAKVLMSMMLSPFVFKRSGKHDLLTREERAIYLRRSIRIFLDGVRPR